MTAEAVYWRNKYTLVGAGTPLVKRRAKTEWCRPLTVKHPPGSVGAECTVGLVAVGGLGVEDAVNVMDGYGASVRSTVGVALDGWNTGVRVVEQWKALQREASGVAVGPFVGLKREAEVARIN